MIRCPQCGMTSHHPDDEREHYCGNCHQFHGQMTDQWFKQVIDYLRALPSDLTPEQIAEHIHRALQIAEVEKYATEESCFTFVFTGATDEDLAKIRKHLTPFENSIVEIERKAE